MQKGSMSPPGLRKDYVPTKNFWTDELICYFLKVGEGSKYGE